MNANTKPSKNIPKNILSQIKSLDHHAYCIPSFPGVVETLVAYLDKEFGIERKQNADFFSEKYEILSIGDTRKIKELHSDKSFSAESKKVFIIECDGITHEAQNALLKILEEPNENNYFFIIIPRAGLLIPTLRSRMVILSGGASKNTIDFNASDFLQLKTKDKMAFVTDLSKKISDEKLPKSAAVEFLSLLEEEIYSEQNIEKNRKALEAIVKALDYISDRGASVKQLLEFVVLNM